MENDLAIVATDFKAISSDDGKLSIEGYANTIDKDRYGDVVLPSAFKMDNYNKNPIILLQHDQNQPIGTMVSYEVTDQGLKIKVEISNAAEDLYRVKTLINDGVLRAFSIGFRMLKGKYIPEDDIYVIQELELLEVSIVSVPANQDSVFTVSKSFNTIKEAAILEAKALITTTDSNSEETEVETETVEIVDESTTVTTTETVSTEKEVTVETVVDDGESDTPVTDPANTMAAGKTVSETEQKNTNNKEDFIMDETIEKAIADAVEKARLDAEKKIAADAKASEVETKAKEAEEARIATAVEKALEVEREKAAGIPTGRDGVEMPTMTLSLEQEREYVKQVDDLYLLSILLDKPMTSLEAFKALPEVVTKAVVNTGGTALAPVGFDKRLMEDMRQILKIEPLFASFNMPLADYRLPFNAAGVSAEWQVAGGTPADQSVTFDSVLFTAKKLMSVVGFNYEDEDDSVVAMLPTIRQELAYGMAQLLETTLVAGAGIANDFRGLTDYATGAGVSHNYDITGGVAVAFTPAHVAAARAMMGRYGVDPSKVVLLINLQDYFDLVGDTLVTTIQNFGPQATVLKGQLATIWGIPIIPTESIATAAAVGDVRACLVRPDRFKLGYRKGMNVETWRDPRNQTKSLTAAMRMDFNPLVPLTAGQLAAGQTFIINLKAAL